jgi:hypothetical protein
MASESSHRSRGNRRGALRAIAPALVALVAVVVLAPSTKADTLDFRAEIDDHSTKVPGCADGAFICGEAILNDFGPAIFSYFLTSVTPVPEGCGGYVVGMYTATTIFTLPDGSRLTLDESGSVCGPGNSLTAPGGRYSYGNPVDGNGVWDVETATGRFAGLTGSGTDTFRSAGAHVVATYIGTPEG